LVAEPLRDRGRLEGVRSAPLQFAVGLKLKSKSEHVIVDAEDALIAALKVKAERPEALIMYVRRENRRGDARNPPQTRGS
jgi:hypothetical protein